MLLELESIAKSFPGDGGSVPVLREVSLNLDRSQTLALTGESGSGKSTLLHISAGLEIPDSGAVRLDGDDLAQRGDVGRAALRRGTIGVVFQQFNLIPSLTVAGNIDFQAKLSDRHDPHYSAHLIEQLELTPHLGKYPESLSGGQQQRVAIARALAMRPSLLLADEPTGNLDERTADGVLQAMLALVAETEAALMVVTHSMQVAGRMSRKLHLSNGQLT